MLQQCRSGRGVCRMISPGEKRCPITALGKPVSHQAPGKAMSHRAGSLALGVSVGKPVSHCPAGKSAVPSGGGHLFAVPRTKPPRALSPWEKRCPIERAGAHMRANSNRQPRSSSSGHSFPGSTIYRSISQDPQSRGGFGGCRSRTEGSRGHPQRPGSTIQGSRSQDPQSRGGFRAIQNNTEGSRDP